MYPEIRNPSRLKLPPGISPLLAAMFSDYRVIVVKDEFSSLGYSGSWVYRVHLLKGSDVPELPLVVKIAPSSAIAQEVRAFQECVRNQWPGIAELRDQPVYLDKDGLGGLCYPLMGGGVFRMQSLREYCLQADTEDVLFVLRERLFRMMKERMLRPAQNGFEFSLRASYDRLLPVNLLVEPKPDAPPGWGESRQDAAPTHIVPGGIPDSPPQPGQRVCLEGFTVTEVNPRQRSVTLDVPPGCTSCAYRWRLQPVDDLAAYALDERAPRIEGVVCETRQSRFRSELVPVLGSEFDPASETVTTPDGQVLPNPLLATPDLLARSRHIKVSAIHGDLNLENVLVDPQVRDVRLIDFARARRDHVLHDFFRLETEVVTKLLPAALAEAQVPSHAIGSFYRELHWAECGPDTSGAHCFLHPALEKTFAILRALREASREGLYCRDDVNEYYEGLVLYLLSALKFRNLGVVSKQVAFWGAATAVDLLQRPVHDAQASRTRRLVMSVEIARAFSIRLLLCVDDLRQRTLCSEGSLCLTRPKGDSGHRNSMGGRGHLESPVLNAEKHS